MPFTLNPSDKAFATVSEDGELLSVESTIGSAAQAANELGYDVIRDQTWEEGKRLPMLTQNARPSAQLALKKIDGIRIDIDAVRDMTIAEAVSRLHSMVPMKNGKPLVSYKTPSSFVDEVLVENYKTAKGHPEVNVAVKAVALAPHQLWWENVGKHWDFDPTTLCVGASVECMRSCLIFTGQNAADIHNDRIKLARTSWFMQEPDAFGVVLMDAVRKHRDRSLRDGSVPMVRLNLLSDIPWELVFPELFEAFPDVQFYDYTKVPGRIVPDNYDLTFSFSGRNLDYCDSEIDEFGRKVACVFLPDRWRVMSWEGDVLDEAETRNKAQLILRKSGDKGYVTAEFPQVFMGLETVDGDKSDARPLDPSPRVVALAYKQPKLRSAAKGGAMGKVVTAAPAAFVTPVYRVDGHYLVAEVPRHTPGAQSASDSDTLPEGADVDL